MISFLLLCVNRILERVAFLGIMLVAMVFVLQQTMGVEGMLNLLLAIKENPLAQMETYNIGNQVTARITAQLDSIR